MFGRDGNQLETSSTGEVIVKRTVTVREVRGFVRCWVETVGMTGKGYWCNG